MRRLTLFNALAVLLLSFSALLNAAPQEQSQAPPAPAISAATYPETTDGLRHFIWDIFAAMDAEDNEKESALFSTLEIPDHSAWFMKMFGPTEGPRLDAKYTEMLPGEPTAISQRLESALIRGGKTEIEAGVVPEPASGALGRAAAEAMLQPFPTYSVSAGNPNEKYITWIGEFVYVDGGFRLLDQNVFQALSTAPPLTLRVGGNVEASRLIHQVAPIYPLEAKVEGVQGTVVLHAIIGKDGKIEELTLVSGHPLLVPPAVNAVRQWRYQPCLLSGRPVAVDTTITVVFRLER